jgi:hypothetical protein
LVGFQGFIFVACRKHLNDPPTAVGGILCTLKSKIGNRKSAIKLIRF